MLLGMRTDDAYLFGISRYACIGKSDNTSLFGTSYSPFNGWSMGFAEVRIDRVVLLIRSDIRPIAGRRGFVPILLVLNMVG